MVGYDDDDLYRLDERSNLLKNAIARLLLLAAKKAPKGYFKLMSLAARLDPALSDYPIRIEQAPGMVLRADLSKTVFSSIFRNGSIPHQAGFDMVVRDAIRLRDTVFDVGANII